MIFKPQNGTPEQQAHLRKCTDMINDIIHTETFANKVDNKVVKQLQNYKEAKVEFFHEDSMKFGAAREEQNLVRLNTKFFGKMFHRDCGRIVHEWLHLFGYDDKGAFDQASTPYAVQDVVERLVQYNDKGSSTKLIVAVCAIIVIALYFILS